MKIRRVVIGHNKEGKSRVKWDSEIETQPRRQGLEQAVLWATDSLPVQLTDEDPAGWNFGISLDNGSVAFLRSVTLSQCCNGPAVRARRNRPESIILRIGMELSWS